jgi:hypothetical protein
MGEVVTVAEGTPSPGQRASIQDGTSGRSTAAAVDVAPESAASNAVVRVGDEASLHVLTATLLAPARFPSVLGDDYPAACAVLGLRPLRDGYGLVLGQDGLGARWTVVTSDTALVAVAIATWDCGMEYDLSPGGRTIVASLPGWPLELVVATPGLPAPHDPDDPSAGPVLAPPDTASWGPAQRRLGADEVALRWKAWRAEIDDARAVPTTAGGGKPSHPGVRRALTEAAAYVASPPPAGRVRSSFAENGARALRVDGPGWSLVARTDDIAFVLLDDSPGEVLPVGRGSELPALLDSLERIAVRTDT